VAGRVGMRLSWSCKVSPLLYSEVLSDAPCWFGLVVYFLTEMKTTHKVLTIVAAIALTTLTLNAKWFSTWAEEAKGSKPRDQDAYRVVSPNGDIRSVACSADGKMLFVVCANGWVKGPAGKGYGTQFESALFKSTDGGETWSVLKGD